jgi:hypothetical protein
VEVLCGGVSPGRLWWRAKEAKLQYLLYFFKVAGISPAATTSKPRGGHDCRRDQWPKGRPF